MRKDWRDPRDGTTWVVDIWEPTTLPMSGSSIPRVISFRRQAAFEVYSTGIEEAVAVSTFSDDALQALLDVARARVRR